jgi:hypothetical protein
VDDWVPVSWARDRYKVIRSVADTFKKEGNDQMHGLLESRVNLGGGRLPEPEILHRISTN